MGGSTYWTNNHFYGDFQQVIDQQPRAAVGENNSITRLWPAGAPGEVSSYAAHRGTLVAGSDVPGEPAYEVRFEVALNGWPLDGNEIKYNGVLGKYDYLRFPIDKAFVYSGGSWNGTVVDTLLQVGSAPVYGQASGAVAITGASGTATVTLDGATGDYFVQLTKRFISGSPLTATANVWISEQSGRKFTINWAGFPDQHASQVSWQLTRSGN